MKIDDEGYPQQQLCKLSYAHCIEPDEVLLIEHEGDDLSLGAKSIGEISMCLLLLQLSMVNNALGTLSDLPVTADKILAALTERRGGSMLIKFKVNGKAII